MYQREFDKKVRIGIVGAGSHTYRNLLPALHYLPAELVAVCNRGEDKLNRTLAEYHCPGYTDPVEMYKKEKLDAVVMAISPQRHAAMACEAMEHGLHVFMEKPASMSVEEIDQMIEVSRRTGKFVVVGYKKAFMPVTQKTKEIVRSDKYPGMSSILGVYPLYLPQDGKKALDEGEVTEWLKNGCHPLSLMLEVAGPVKSVQSLIGESGFGVVHLKFNNGVVGTLHLAAGAKPAKDEYRVYGDGWSVEIECSHRIRLRRGIPYEYEYTDNFAPAGEIGGDIVWEPMSCQASLENKALYVQGMVQEMQYFCECILKNEAPVTASLDFTRHLTQVYEAALLSGGKEIVL